jgi:hypothetical protein
MRNVSFRCLVLAILTVVMGVGVMAQDGGRTTPVSSKYLISAKAGGVNNIEGIVTVTRPDATSGMVLKGDQIEVGEKLSTAADGRIEILLNPGSYLRLGPDSSAEFKTTSLDDLQIKLDKGSSIFEVFATDEFVVSVFTPKGLTKLAESGVYRFDLASDGGAVVSVIEGKAIVGSTTVKEGRAATIDGSSKVAITKFDRDKRDDLAGWSRTRSKVLAGMTASLRNRDMRDSLMTSFIMGRWGIMDSFGLWVYNGRYGTYCFLPFGYGWYSPYGYGLGPGIGWYNLPPVVYNPPVGVPNGSTRASSGVVKSAPAESVRAADPPFTRIRDRDVVRVPKSVFRDDMTGPTRSAPASMPSPIVSFPSSTVRSPGAKKP